MRKNYMATYRAGLIAFFMTLLTLNSVYAQGVPVGSLQSDEKADIERILKDEVARQFEIMRENGRDVRPNDVLSIRLDPKDNSVHVDFDRRILGKSAVEMEPFLQQVNGRIHDTLSGIVEIRDIHWYFNGRNLYEYYPGENPPQPVSVTPSILSEVVVNAGHGRFLRNFPPGVWDWQRPFMFGVREDLITPEYASVLADLLAGRSLIGTQFTRSQAITIHAPSENPWREVAARYYLEQLLPGESHIWDGPTGHSDLHEGQDINSRPRYANFINAESLISIHTNGDDDSSVRGTRVYVAPGRPVDYARAQSMLCYMREIIQAQEGYEDFTVSPAPHTFNHGENTIATMPAVIVEVAFHSNPDDAAAILDPVFQEASMKGVEKGYRLHKEDKPCEHYEITDIPDFTAPWGGSGIVEINFVGHPQYPVDLVVEDIDCSTICWPGGGTIPSEVPSPILIGLTCDGEPDSPPASAVWRATLTDADNVSTDFEYTSTCQSGPTAVGSSNRNGSVIFSTSIESDDM